MTQVKRHSLVYNFSWLGIIQVCNFLLSLVVIPYTIRIVAPEGFGVIAVAQVVVFYLSVTTDYGFNRTAIRDVALYKNDRQRISKVFSTVIVSKLLISIIAFIVLLALVAIVPLFRTHYKLYLLAFSFVIGQAVLVNWFFQGLEKMKYMAVASLFSRLLFVGLVFLFIKQKDDAPLYLFFMGVGNIAAGLVSIYAARRMYKLHFILPTRSDIAFEIKEGWQVTVSNLSMTTIQYIGIFILRIFTNDIVVGYYSIAEKIYFAMKLMLDVFSQAAYPRVCRLLQQGIDRVKEFFRRTYLPFLATVFAGAAFIFICSPWIIKFFAGHPNDYTSLLLRLLCFAVIIVCANIPACLVLLAGDHKKNYMRIFSIGTLVCIIANISLDPFFDAKGTVIAVLITELFITTGLYFEVFRIYRQKAGKQSWTSNPNSKIADASG
jgi:PST family polysaccharide transporter